MGKKFDKIFEAVVGRYNSGGYLPGDLVKFRPNYKSSPTYNAMHSVMKSELDELVNSGLNIRVVQIGTNKNTSSVALDHKLANDVSITIAGDQGGGRNYGSITVSPDMIDILSSSDPSPAVPDQFYRKDNTNFKPEEYTADPNNITRVTDKGKGKNTPTNIKLAGESTRLKKDNEAMGLLYEQI